MREFSHLSVNFRLCTQVMVGGELPTTVVLITGWGRHSRQPGESEVKAAVLRLLQDNGSPFQVRA